MSDGSTSTEDDKNIEMWKVKKLIKNLELARGNGTSMISLIIPPKDQISRASRMLADEYGTASNIKSRVNRLSVLEAITSTQQRLKLYTRVPENGLVIYCGTVLTDENKEKKVTIDFEPFRPINTSLYLCDNKFHTEPLSALLESDEKFGFIVMDGNGALYGTLCGNTREVMHKFGVELPKKHGRGGQSAMRFARLRLEKRHNYLRKVSEIAVQMFITNDKPNVSGLIIAGSADFKTELSASDMFDQRLQGIILKVVDVAYGGENGFNQAIELAQEVLLNVKFIREKKCISEFFDEISLDTGKYVYGVEETVRSMEMGALKTLIVWENLDIIRYTLRAAGTGGASSGGSSSSSSSSALFTSAAGAGADGAPASAPASNPDDKVLLLTPEQAKDTKHFRDETTGTEYDVEDVALLEWLANNYKRYGCAIEFVSDKSPEGSQFVKGFGGIGGMLRYRLDMGAINTYLEQGMDEQDDLEDFI